MYKMFLITLIILTPLIVSADCSEDCDELYGSSCSLACASTCGSDAECIDTCVSECGNNLNACLVDCGASEEATGTACSSSGSYEDALAACNSAFSSANSACGSVLTSDCGGSISATDECAKAEAWDTAAARCGATTSPADPTTTTTTTTTSTPAQGTTATVTTTLDNPLKAQGDNPVAIIGNIIRAMLGVVGAVTLLMFLYGGFMLIFSAGEQEKLEKGRKTLVWAVIGLAVVLSSYSILSYVFKILVGSTT